MAGQTKSREWCIENDIGLTKATGESTNTVGGFLAPLDFDEAIISVRETMGAFRAGRRGQADAIRRPGETASGRWPHREFRRRIGGNS